MADDVVHTIGLCKDYTIGQSTVHALVDASVTVGRGEFIAVMGPSGSGKSTLMNLLGCLDRPTRGRYLFEGVDIAELDADARASLRNRKIGFVFQSFNLLPRATALDNVELPLTYGRRSRKDRRGQAERALASLGLADRIDHRPSQLSGGQQQRVAIARALVSEPALILADEPTGALDTRTGAEIMGLFQRLNRDGMTIVLVTHEHEVAQFAKRVLSFRDGKLIADKRIARPTIAVEQLAEDAATPRVA